MFTCVTRKFTWKTEIWKLVARISPSTMLRCHSKLKQIFVNYISTYRVQTHWFVMEIFVFPKTSADWNSLAGLITENFIIDLFENEAKWNGEQRYRHGAEINYQAQLIGSYTRSFFKLNYLQFKLITHRRKIFYCNFAILTFTELWTRLGRLGESGCRKLISPTLQHFADWQ